MDADETKRSLLTASKTRLSASQHPPLLNIKTKPTTTTTMPTRVVNPLASPTGMRALPYELLLHANATAGSARRIFHKEHQKQHQHELKLKQEETYTVFLIRHGEASHNVKEKSVMQKALNRAIAEGLSPDCEETKLRMERARMAVLYDERLFDAPLSRRGRQEAKAASNQLKELIREHRLPPPREVLVSPLTRALETANLIFPEHNNIHVREELRERCTGKPPDNRSPSGLLRSRRSFQRFSMDRLQSQSQLDLLDLLDDENDEEDDLIYPRTRRSISICSEYSDTEEDKAMLRARTKRLFDLLAESQERSIVVVTHKAFLRELERGQFGEPLSSEFQNCEIRVYRVKLFTSEQSTNELEHTERLI